ncbi:GNAT family N-acetyltransferase [Streptomyces sp. NBC_00669]|uniref:GNAT family N-acetyltransferase n=1 Tax=Streptomyces sp. NBC_00669 TaxID=2976011 RepID=UPI002E34612C|nr:GNAT family N-acetyltransferase [Streptomyces sp. NBC_00669]
MTWNARIRRMADDDWEDVVGLETRAYAALGLSEGRAALESKARVSPATCFALELVPGLGADPGADPGAGARLAGYLLALPYPERSYPGLARSEEAAAPSRNLHLHDLVIAEDVRGRGLGKRLLGRLTAAARAQGYEQISLIAVGGSHTFWSASGFTARDGVEARGYGPGSVYMTMALPSGQVEGDRTAVGGLPIGAPSREEVG